MTVVVTGGAGFIGSTLVRALVADGERAVTVDKLTYAGNLDNLAPVLDRPNHVFLRADICDRTTMAAVFEEHRPRAVYNLAAESHVDRTIDTPATCVETNIVGTATLLEAALGYWRTLDAAGRAGFRFLQVSTDEVYGELGPTGQFNDESRYRPSSPYSASKAGADHLARAAAAQGLSIIHLSTDYVYAGTAAASQREGEPIAPLNVYGASKVAGDAAVASANTAHLLLRVSWVFGVYGANFVKTMLRLGHERSELRVVADQTGGPTEARDIADAIIAMAAAFCRPGFSAWGVYHFAGAPSTSWHGFAQAIFERARGPRPRLVSIPSRDYPTAAVRPLNSTLDCRRIREMFGIEQPDWRLSLSHVVADLEKAAR